MDKERLAKAIAAATSSPAMEKQYKDQARVRLAAALEALDCDRFHEAMKQLDFARGFMRVRRDQERAKSRMFTAKKELLKLQGARVRSRRGDTIGDYGKVVDLELGNLPRVGFIVRMEKGYTITTYELHESFEVMK